jgi:uncharacterized membrane protein (DUF485 family)
MTELVRTVPIIDTDRPVSTRGAIDRHPRSVLQSDAFRRLMSVKRRTIVPLLGPSLLYTLTVALLAGYAPGVMALKVVGSFTLGYLLVLGVYVVCWLVSVIYVWMANKNFESLALDVARDRQGDLK